MEDKTIQINLKCLFCDGILEGDTEKKYSSGDMITCLNCNELNDYDALIDVAKEEGIDELKQSAEDEIKKSFGKIFK